MSDKSEKPTQKRLKDQRKEGQLPQRKNVIEAGFLVFSMMMLVGISQKFTLTFMELEKLTLSTAAISDFPSGLQLTFDALVGILQLLLLFCAAASGFTLLFGLFLNGFNIAPKAMTPKFQKLNPVGSLRSIFSKSTLYTFIRLVIYFTMLTIHLYAAIYTLIPYILKASYCGARCVYPLLLTQIKETVITIICVIIIMAALDYKVQTMLFISQNKMSKDDVKMEYKGQEGDPRIRGQRKNLAHIEANEPGPKEATHVVYGNGFLVAFIYHEAARQRPYVVAKAKGPNVNKVQERFEAFGIPTFNFPMIARDFHFMAPIGAYLPPRSAIGIEKIVHAVSIRKQANKRQE